MQASEIDTNGANVDVMNMSTMAVASYTGISPREAVIAAYAQNSQTRYSGAGKDGKPTGDWNTWQYEARYGGMVMEGKDTYSIGDWAALKIEAAGRIRAAKERRQEEARRAIAGK